MARATGIARHGNGEIRLADVAVVFDAYILKLALVGAADFLDDELVFRQIVETGNAPAVVQNGQPAVQSGLLVRQKL